MFFIVEKSEERTFEFSQNSLNIISKRNTKIINLLRDSSNKRYKCAAKKIMVCYRQVNTKR